MKSIDQMHHNPLRALQLMVGLFAKGGDEFNAADSAASHLFASCNKHPLGIRMFGDVVAALAQSFVSAFE
jgi:hypothetical protein